MDETVLTIIIPCYNAEQYLCRCMKSLNGLSDEIKVLFVNDGSIDATENIIKDYIVGKKNTSYISKKNGGYSSAINAGLDNCDSDYVMFMGVDDEISSKGLNVIIKHLIANSPDILVFQTKKIYDDKEHYSEVDLFTNYKLEGVYKEDIYSLCRDYGSDCNILFFRDTSRCYKRSIIEDIRYYGKYGVAADGCFSSLIAHRAKTFEFVKIVGYYWHLHVDSVSSQKKDVLRIIDEVGVWNKYFEEILRTKNSNGISNPVIMHFLEYINAVIQLKSYKEFNLVKKHMRFINKARIKMFFTERITIKARITLLIPKFILLYIRLKTYLSVRSINKKS